MEEQISFEAVPGSSLLETELFNDDALLRLFAFSGGGADDFVGWAQNLGQKVEVEVVRVRIPAPAAEAGQVLDGVIKDLLACMSSCPFSFWGHGEEGAHMALVVAGELQARGLPLPQRLITSFAKPKGCGAELAPLACPLVVFGLQEDVVSMQAWVDQTRSEFVVLPVAGITEDTIDEVLKITPGAENPLLGHMASLMASDSKNSREESASLIDAWNSSSMAYPENACLQDMFRDSLSGLKDPNATAIWAESRKLSYAEVDALTDQLANWFYAQGVRVGSVVGVFMNRNAEYALSVLGVLKAGGAYMPIETVLPVDLLRSVLEEVKPVVVVTQSNLRTRLPLTQACLLMDATPPSTLGEGESWQERVACAPALPLSREMPTPDSQAYVVMSSGTTGTPKGICCPHRGAVHSYYYRLLEYPYEEDDREACNVFFVWEMLRPLLGGTKGAGGATPALYVIPDDHIYNPVKLVEFLGKHRITRMLFTPSLLQLVLSSCSVDQLKQGMKSMRIVWLCGEVVSIDLCTQFCKILPGCQLVNLYSISECHDIGYADLTSVDTRESPKFAPCGKVIPNVTAYIVDDNMRQVPVGVPGRMFIGGPCLALGYLNMPVKTAERFVACPFVPAIGGSQPLMYDTGDRCRFLPSGSIEVLGRCDFMVKIRGYSVVIGAVETAIADHPLVSTACVLTEGEEGSMTKRLVAYVVPADWERLPSVQSIQIFIKTKLPPYAVPSVFILLDAIPINMASGKLDRRKLPNSESGTARRLDGDWAGDAGGGGAGVNSAAAPAGDEPTSCDPPSSATEKRVSEIWAALLDMRVATIERSHDFFDLGGHSLLLIKCCEAIEKAWKEEQEVDISVSIEDILSRPTLADLAAHIDQVAGTGDGTFIPPDGPVRRPRSASNTASDVPMTSGADTVDIAAEAARLDQSIFPAPTRKQGYARLRSADFHRPPFRVLLTGATGYLGVHLLSALLTDSEAEVFCLVRAADEHAAMLRVESALSEFGLLGAGSAEDGEDSGGLQPDHLARIVPIPGDLSRPLLGMTDGDFKQLAGELDAIIHNGAAVNLVRSYTSLKKVNVLGTQEVLRLAVTNGISTRVKPVHYVSTNGVFPFADSAQSVFLEDANMAEAWRHLHDGYGQSKWVAESFCRDARGRGLPVSIYRPGNMAPSSSQGAWNQSDFIYLLLRGCVELKAFPDEAWKLDMTPVDFAARAIVDTAVLKPAKALGKVLHVQNPKPSVRFSDVVQWLEASLQVTMEGLPLDAFRERLSAAVDAMDVERRDSSATVLPQLLAGIGSFGQYLASDARMDSKELHKQLKGTGITCPPVDAALIATYAKGLLHEPQ